MRRRGQEPACPAVPVLRQDGRQVRHLHRTADRPPHAFHGALLLVRRFDPHPRTAARSHRPHGPDGYSHGRHRRTFGEPTSIVPRSGGARRPVASRVVAGLLQAYLPPPVPAREGIPFRRLRVFPGRCDRPAQLPLCGLCDLPRYRRRESRGIRRPPHLV